MEKCKSWVGGWWRGNSGQKTFCGLWHVALVDSPPVAIAYIHCVRKKEEMKNEQKIVAKLKRLMEKLTFDWLRWMWWRWYWYGGGCGLWIITLVSYFMIVLSNFQLQHKQKIAECRTVGGGTNEGNGHVFWHGLGVKLSLYGGRIGCHINDYE